MLKKNNQTMIEKVIKSNDTHNGSIVTFSASSFAEYLSKIIKFKQFPRYILYDIEYYENFINNNRKYPLIILGLYHIYNWDSSNFNNPQVFYKELIKNIDKVVIYFIGTDIVHFKQIEYNKRNSIINYLKQHNCRFACESKYIKDDIYNNLNLDCHIIPMPIKNKNIFKNGFNFPNDNLHIGIYMPTTSLSLYNHEIIKEIILKCPNYSFYYFCNGGYKKSNNDIIRDNITYFENEISMDELYSKVNCLIRITDNDGEPQTGIETMMLGKYFIFNKDMPFCKNIGDNKLDYVNNTIIFLNEINSNLIFNKEASEYYLHRNSDDNFIKNINNILK